MAAKGEQAPQPQMSFNIDNLSQATHQDEQPAVAVPPELSHDTGAEIQILCNRIKDGNNKLWERWQFIRRMLDGSGKDKFIATWDEANSRLLSLLDELTKLGFHDCLYQDDKPHFMCLVCPKESWQPADCPAWRIEI